MFTPPPSPLPSTLTSFHVSNSPLPSYSPSPPSSPQQFLTPGLALSLPLPKHSPRRRQPETRTTIQDRKRRIAWCTGLMVIIVPLILVLITFLKRFASYPIFWDLLAGPPPGLRVLLATRTDEAGHPVRALHRRQTGAITMSSAAPSASGTDIVFPSAAAPTSTPVPSQTVPTIPSSPPVLPTPFPQPFDTTLGNNFTTNSCETFFTNMTQSLPFRQCRPFSFLSQTSSAFLKAQSNLTELNIDVWGTCNTPVDADQCAANMGWFTTDLLDACSQEKSDNNQIVMQTLASLQSYSLMRQVACLADQNTSTYCYIEAAGSSNPSDLYFYSLPFGIPLPNNTDLSCSGCTKSVMALFAANTSDTEGLKKTYSSAAYFASSKCGSTYVWTQSASTPSSSALPWFGDRPSTGWMIVMTLGVLLMGLL